MKMTIKNILLAGCFILLPAFLQNIKAGEANTWTSYPSFGNISWGIKIGEKYFILDSGNLFYVDRNTEEVRIFDKTNGLSDCGIDKIRWSDTAKKLFVLYSDQNIDFVDLDGNVTNLSDYYNKSTTLDKTINGLNVYGDNAFLSTNFGIVQVNMNNMLIQQTINLGFAVKWTDCDDEYLYAYTTVADSTTYRAPLNSNLLDKSQWKACGKFKNDTTKMDENIYSKVKAYIPNGPKSTYSGYSIMRNNNLYAVPGHGSEGNRPAYVQIYDGSKWTNLSDDISYLSSRRFRNLYFIIPYPGQDNRFFLGGETGLYDMVDNKVVKEWWFNNTNSVLQAPQSLGPTHTNWSIVSTGAFDSNNNFWCFSGEAPNPGICKLDPNGNWTFYPHEEMRSTEEVAFVTPASAFFDSRGILWFTNNNWQTPALARYDISTDEMKAFTSFVNEDGTTISISGGVTSTIEDKNGNIWVGCSAGTFYIAADDVEKSNPTFQQVKVPRNDGSNLADYLLANIPITCIAIDGGNRKWFGTDNNGVYVISNDCMTEVHHFTAENSELLSNSIEHITIDGNSGEVFIATNRGLCSYRAGATTPQQEMKSSNIYAYPNPVTPSFTGMVTVNGLTYNSFIKIVNASGCVVNEGRSAGGSYQWNGCDQDGNKVASGVYTVLAVDQDGKESGGCKIAIVR